MINIDKEDELYKYLLKLGVEDKEKVYLELAQNGRYKRKDIQTYLNSKFQPSVTNELNETDLEPILDYYVDIKKLPRISNVELKQNLKEFYLTKNKKLMQKIQQAYLKDVLYMCINYKTLHKDVDLQDLVQTANIGLLNAVKKYNPNNRLDFKDYIVFYIRESIIKEFEEKN